MTMTEWAEREIKLACRRENPDWDGESFDYGCSCYQSALKAYRSLMADGHSGFSFSLTKQILNRLMDGKPLAPITDEDFFAEGFEPHVHENRETDRQCPRMYSLFRYESKDGSVRYHDVDRAICRVDIDGVTSTWHNSTASKLVDELFPISMPYMPPDKQFVVHMEQFLADPANGDYDTEAILGVVTPDGEKINVHKYWTEKDGKMVEIKKDEYEELKKKAEQLKTKANGNPTRKAPAKKDDLVEQAVKEFCDDNGLAMVVIPGKSEGESKESDANDE